MFLLLKKTVYIKTSDRIKVEMIESRKNEERKQKYLIRAWYIIAVGKWVRLWNIYSPFQKYIYLVTMISLECG